MDFFLAWFVIYRLLLLTKSSGAVQIFIGLGVLAIFYFISVWLQLITFNWIFEKFFSNLILIIFILFHSEIRKGLAQLGTIPFLKLGPSAIEEARLVDELSKGVMQVAQKGYGALIVLEKEINLDYFLELGVFVESLVKAEIIFSFFQPTSPMHDGALLIRDGRISYASCFLPLSKNPALDKNLGTRHRAALGLAEETDAIVLVVSEENQSVSCVEGMSMSSDLDHNSLREKLVSVFGSKKKVS